MKHERVKAGNKNISTGKGKRKKEDGLTETDDDEDDNEKSDIKKLMTTNTPKVLSVSSMIPK